MLQILKLINGDEIMGEVDSTTKPNHVIVENPVRIIVVPSKADPQNPAVGFAPWAQFTKEKSFTIHNAHVIVSMSPVQQFVAQYKAMFSGIVTPSSNLIMPGT